MYTVIIIVAISIVLLISIYLTILNVNLTRLLNTIDKIIEIKMDTDKSILKHNYSVKSSRELLEYLVEQKLMDWRIYNVNPSSDNYITEEDMKACIEYIIKKIMLEMTPTTKDVLSVGYPMETETDMIESIKNRAKIAVLNYSIQQNNAQEHEEIIKNINVTP